ncbi:hypothetical protein QR680_009441 [Steinernema hermaphroditum]|uniref:Uncharacterized protein n=1 Tax=Steinernema hermaphroditum TaxID=289476 RepID=A0AA39IKA5_9BILA|nr:hypothetical protein QR680_009441 [Steinernema hermaphroditum]
MILDFSHIVFVVSMTLLVTVLSVIFIKRQALRMRNNSARKEVSGVIALELSKRKRDTILTRIGGVGRFRQAHIPTFTDCTIISDHATSPYVHRMIAIDEIVENIDRQVEMIDPTAGRRPGESTYAFLKRLRECAGCQISLSQAERLGFLHELCRSRLQWPFDSTHLKELRGLLKDFLKILNDWQKNRSEAKANDSDDGGLHYRISSSKSKRFTNPLNGSGECLASNNQLSERRPLLGKAHPASESTVAAEAVGEDHQLLVSQR